MTYAISGATGFTTGSVAHTTLDNFKAQMKQAQNDKAEGARGGKKDRNAMGDLMQKLVKVEMKEKRKNTKAKNEN